jgi:hypothetical protein
VHAQSLVGDRLSSATDWGAGGDGGDAARARAS